MRSEANDMASELSPSAANVLARKPVDAWSQWRDRLGALLNAHPVFFAFLALALAIRLVFWLYTGRIWEDALITLTPARNAWEGFGLTHHASEPRVHSFTSPISVLIPLAGEAIGQGLFALRLASLVATVFTIYFAYRIGTVLKLSLAAHVFVLGYLSADQLQIFFGMAGMETQVSVAVLLANVYYYMTRQWNRLGIAIALALLCRPDFVIWPLIVGAGLLLYHRDAIVRVVLISAALFFPWLLFTLFYYGSPIPNTIVAKTHSFKHGFLTAPLSQIREYALGSWAHMAPIKQFFVAGINPFPDWSVQLAVALFLGCSVIGIIATLATDKRLVPAVCLVGAFIVYKIGSIIPSYFMWYLPPFLAVLAVIAGYGITAVGLRARVVATAIAAYLSFMYAVHIPFTFPLDRVVQREIEWGVRYKVGQCLDELMGPKDTAVLEPLGYVGWAARNKTIYDFPGLGSKVSVAAIKNSRDPGLLGLINALRPTFLVLRPHELRRLEEHYSDVARQYVPLEDIKVSPSLNLFNMGYQYGTSGDDRFVILGKSGASATAGCASQRRAQQPR